MKIEHSDTLRKRWLKEYPDLDVALEDWFLGWDLNVGLVRDHSVNYWGCEKRNIRRQGCCWWNNFPPLFSTMAINRVSVPSPDGQKWREFKWLHVSSVPRDVLWWPAPWLFWDCFISLSFFALPWKLVRCFRNSSTLTAKLYFQFCRFPKGS